MDIIPTLCAEKPEMVMAVVLLLILVIIILIIKKYTMKIGNFSLVPKEDRDCCRHRKKLIEEAFLLFKTFLEHMAAQGVIFRLNYLVYDIKNDGLKMCIQDGAYEDSSFSINVKQGEREDIKVCKAIRENRIIMENLIKKHAMKCQDPSIPKTLKSVIAFPISINDKIIGVVALDCSEKIEDLGMGKDDIKNYFLLLCKLISEIEFK